MSQFGRHEIFDVLVWVRIHRALAAQDSSIIQQKIYQKVVSWLIQYGAQIRK